MPLKRGTVKLSDTFDTQRIRLNTLNKDVFGSQQELTISVAANFPADTAYYQVQSGNVVKGYVKDSVASGTTVILKNLVWHSHANADSTVAEFTTGEIGDSVGGAGHTVSGVGDVELLYERDSISTFPLNANVTIGDSTNLFNSLNTVIDNGIFGLIADSGTVVYADSVGKVNLIAGSFMNITYDPVKNGVQFSLSPSGSNTVTFEGATDSSAAASVSATVNTLRFDTNHFNLYPYSSNEKGMVELDVAGINVNTFKNVDSVAYTSTRTARTFVIQTDDSTFSDIGWTYQQLKLDSVFTSAVLAGVGQNSTDVIKLNLKDSCIATNNIQGSAVTTAKIASNAVTNSQLSSTVITGQTSTTTADSADTMLIYDSSASSLRKITVYNLAQNSAFNQAAGGSMSSFSVNTWSDDSTLTFSDGETLYLDSDSTITITAVNNDSVKLVARTATTALKGVASFSSTNFSVSGGGVVTIKNQGVPGTALQTDFISNLSGGDYDSTDSGGKIPYEPSNGTQASGYINLGDITNAVFGLIYPVGSIVHSTKSTNPRYWGTAWTAAYNTGVRWTEIAQGRMLVGRNSTATADLDVLTLGTTGGKATHKLTENELPQHRHSLFTNVSGTGLSSGDALSVARLAENDFALPRTFNQGTDAQARYQIIGRPITGTATSGVEVPAPEPTLGKSGLSGGNSPHNNMPPYQVVTIWERTA